MYEIVSYEEEGVPEVFPGVFDSEKSAMEFALAMNEMANYAGSEDKTEKGTARRKAAV